MANDVKIRLTLDDKVSAGLAKVRGSLDQVGGKGTSGVAFGVLAAKGFSLIAGSALQAGERVGTFIHDSIGAASDLNETISKSKVVFGAAAEGVRAWGSTAATSLGMSENAALGAAASIGNLLLSTGTAKDKIAPMSEGIVQLAADLASFNNIPMEDALAKIQSGLVGQERPLRELGVAISAASVDTEALALGFKKVNGEFTEGQKVQARYSLIFKQTGTAQGDFARTSDQLANSQRILSAEWEDAQAKIGEELLPVALEFVHVLEKNVIPATDTLIGLWHTAAGAADALSGALDTVTGSSKDAGQETDFLGSKTSPLGIALHALAGAAGDVADDIRGIPRASERAAAGMKVWQDVSIEATARYSANQGEISAAALSAAHDVGSATSDMIDSSHQLRSTLLADTKTIVDEAFGTLIAGDNLTATNAEIDAQRRIIASATATKAEKADATAKLHQLQADQLGYLETLAAGGKAGTAEFTKSIAKLNADLAKSHGEESDRIREELRLLNLLAAKAALAHIFDTGSGYKTYGGGQASGGPTSKDKAYIVGENGPELWSENRNGYITPNSDLMGAMAPTSVTLNLNSLWPPTPAQARAIAEVVASELDRRDRRTPTRIA